MRTSDFSIAPPIAQARVEFVGAFAFPGPGAMLRALPGWLRLMRRLRRFPGYRGIQIWYRFPFTVGQMTFFDDRATLFAFAATPEHVQLREWAMRPGNARAGFIRIYEADAGGYSNGSWRAELKPAEKADSVEMAGPGGRHCPVHIGRRRP